MNLVTTAPNFTIVTSGGCNAKCSFCSDDMNRPASTEYIQNLAKALSELPSQFDQVSITGGEPTISPDFLTILYLIKASSRFKKVVLTTNGTKLQEFIPQLKGLVDHINISRHAVSDEQNMAIFGTKRVPDTNELTKICYDLNKLGIDVTLNRVYVNPSSDDSPITLSNEIQVRQFAEFAKKVGASAVAFRHDQNTQSLKETWVEHVMTTHGYTKINEGGCPVCRSHTHLVNGMPCMFKASLAEPGESLDEQEVYELIYHTDGRLCTDWAARREYDPVSGTVLQRQLTNPSQLLEKLQARQHQEVSVNASRQIEVIKNRPSLVKRPEKTKRLSTEVTSLEQLPAQPYIATGQPTPSGCGQVQRSGC